MRVVDEILLQKIEVFKLQLYIMDLEKKLYDVTKYLHQPLFSIEDEMWQDYDEGVLSNMPEQDPEVFKKWKGSR